ncbi:hypothetical protein [Glaciibacter sp. 2TAF33]|uniref:hypothetical protein n=1 Tax=Glaciibacter sp. 2TAF33 TaxID=3233015 RepID=UPI003F925282
MLEDPDGAAHEFFVRSLGGTDAAVQGIGAGERSERLAALRRQRMLLAGLREEAESALVGFPADHDSEWVSDAQRVYAARRSELRHELVLAVRALEAAVAGVAAAIAELSAAG